MESAKFCLLGKDLDFLKREILKTMVISTKMPIQGRKWGDCWGVGWDRKSRITTGGRDCSLGSLARFGWVDDVVINYSVEQQGT